MYFVIKTDNTFIIFTFFEKYWKCKNENNLEIVDSKYFMFGKYSSYDTGCCMHVFGILENACTDTRIRTGGHGQADTDTRTRTVMEKTDSYGKDGQLWKRRAVMEKTDTYGKDGHLWKRRTLMEKTDTSGKDGHKAFETNFLSFKKDAHTVL